MTQAVSTDDAILASVAQHGGVRAAASALGIPYSTFRRWVARAKEPQAAFAEAPASASIPVTAPVAVPAVALPPEMMSMLSAMAAAFTAAQKPAATKAAVTVEADKDEGKPEKPAYGGTHERPEARVRFREGRRFVITSAQNNTSLHEGFWASLATYCERNSAELLVSTFAYNTKGFSQPHRTTKHDASLWYAPELGPHLCNEPTQLAPGLLLCGQAEISPTAVNPLSGFEDFTRACSGIFPHTKVHMQSMPALKGKPERFMYTTGACTLANYIQRKAGQKAEFDHIIGALIVEVDEDNDWFVRQVNAEADGSFQDLNTIYTPTGTRHGVVEAITWGDWHVEKQDVAIREACLGRGGILDTLRPREQHHHDLLDFTARNHHNVRDGFFLAEMAWRGTDLVEDGIKMCAEFLEEADRPWCKQILAISNHCSAFERWLREDNGLTDPNPDNQIYWLEWRKQRLLAIKHQVPDFDVFERAVREHTAVQNVRWLRQDESYVICEEHGGGIECSIHGHEGVNGAKGSPRGYRGLGIRLNTDHTHSPGIIGGIYTGGVNGAKAMGYNRGAGSWSHSDIITYGNSKRTILTKKIGKDGTVKWRAKPRIRIQAIGRTA